MGGGRSFRRGKGEDDLLCCLWAFVIAVSVFTSTMGPVANPSAFLPVAFQVGLLGILWCGLKDDAFAFQKLAFGELPVVEINVALGHNGGEGRSVS